MSYSHNRFLPQPLYNGAPQNFMPLNPQFSQMFNFPTQLNRIPPLTGPLFPPNYFIQQQNNYYNSVLNSASLIAPPNHPSSLIPHRNPFSQWPSQSLAAKSSNACIQKTKRNAEIICLDDEPADNVIVIEDSGEVEPLPVVVKKVEKVQEEIAKSDFKIQDEKVIKQKEPICEINKVQEELPRKRHNRVTKHPIGTYNDHSVVQPKAKKKSIVKEKYTYKLSSHEKHLSQLQQYRAFFPHETVTGPQFQAKIPQLQLFNSKFFAIKGTIFGYRSGTKSYSSDYKG